MRIGRFSVDTPVIVAPMAGVTDLPFRETVLSLSRVWVEGEMVSANPSLLHSEESARKFAFAGSEQPKITQLLGAVPEWMAAAAECAARGGADIIDINMGCPAKKICRTACGSALMRDEELAREIMESVVRSSPVPVTLKMRTGWDEAHLNAPEIASAAEEAGIALVTVHGRTRTQGYSGAAEYRTVRRVKAAVRIPVIANGDIDTPEKAARVLDETGADGVMIGRAALGRPWLPGRVQAFLSEGRDPGDPAPEERGRIMLDHLRRHVAFYGEKPGVRSFRKHLRWYLAELPGGEEAASALIRLEDSKSLGKALTFFFEQAS
ncbi:MAG: tRNA dihydrouridine synthase DusB [Sutterellaceae bacterium]|nr:tRNA dihydrouridine synthase DusB [Sutterellaceae bacterium]MDD7441061.1 tRNA dihydrouridine synthase DusB [Sutterellaceae bacterium]MDY2868951.1 tRNA dihydrouridine synthase DusB [Mesosutterella sp.]